MIKVNELRIGNYFKLGVKYVDLKSFTRTDIYPIETTIYVGYNDKLKNHPIAFAELEPIPLTEEILLKSCNAKIKESEIIINECFIIEELGAGEYFYTCGLGVKLNEKPIKYLHTLQNWYYLHTGGEELEIKL